MPKRIVYVLEPIKIQKKNNGRLASRLCGLKPFLQILPEQDTIGQSGERIVMCIVLQPKILRLQFTCRLPKIACQALHAAMRPIKKLVVTQQKNNEHDAAENEARCQSGVDEMQLANLCPGSIDKSDIILNCR